MPNGGNKCVCEEYLLRQKAPHGKPKAISQWLPGTVESHSKFRPSLKLAACRLFWRTALAL